MENHRNLTKVEVDYLGFEKPERKGGLSFVLVSISVGLLYALVFILNF